MSSKFRIGRPAAGGGTRGFVSVEHMDHLLAFVEPEAETISTQYGEQDAAVCSYQCCVTCKAVVSDAAVFGRALVPRLTDSEEEIVVGRLGQGEAKAGQNPPWLLDDPLEEDLAEVEAFFDACAVRTPSGRIIVEAPSVPADPPF